MCMCALSCILLDTWSVKAWKGSLWKVAVMYRGLDGMIMKSKGRDTRIR